MKITVASGKGGTGKTTFAVNLAWVLSRDRADVQLLDADVEEPNAHLFLQTSFAEEKIVEVLKPVWNQELCTACGLCAAACQYNALAVVKDRVLIFNELCHACGVCSFVCPEGALTEKPHAVGKVRIAPATDSLFFADGVLNVGEPSAPNIIKQLKKYIRPGGISIVDAAPGTGCPVVEALDDADVAVLVTEPTPFGLHDLKLAVSLTLKMEIPTGIVINRSDGNDDLIANYANEVGVPIIGRIPFERAYAETYSQGGIIAEDFPELRTNLLSIYTRLEELAGTEAPPEPEQEKVFTTNALQADFKKGKATDFREIAIISGKGGTGKTTVTASLIQLAGQAVIADNDVDAADLHLLLKPKIYESYGFFGGFKATIDPDICIGCGVCAQSCHFDAIENLGDVCRVDSMACEGCTLCRRVCPVNAVSLNEEKTGAWYISGTEQGPMIHARLGIAQENSGKLVTRVRQEAATRVRELNHPLLMADGPPGTSCPVIASITGVDHVLIVTEPTVSGVHDLKRVLELCRHFGVEASVVINKADLNTEQAQKIHRMAETASVRVVGEIPFDRNVHDALMAGKTIIEYGKGHAAVAIRNIWNVLKNSTY